MTKHFKIINIFLLSLIISSGQILATPATPVISSPESGTGETYNTRPWIYFSATDASYDINDVRVQVSGATTLDYYASDSTANELEFNPLPAGTGVTIAHRVHALNAGSNTITISVANNDIANRWSGTDSVTITVAAAPSWTDDPITAGSTVIKADHFNELKTAIDNLRSFRGSGAGTYVDLPVASSDIIRDNAITELRTAITAPYNEATGSDPTFTDTITAGTTLIRAVHIEELRDDILFP